jgi:succinoglycan biosynthesis protein ExoM
MTNPVKPVAERFVSICIITLRRPKGLARLLDSLDGLQFSRLPEPRIEVVIVDNDADESAQLTVSPFLDRFRWPIRVVSEKRRGIPFARNTALASVHPDATMAAFVDDDERVEPEWLEELVLARERYDADVVAGPVISIFEDSIPDWIRPSFDRPRRPTGTRIEQAGTGNVLLRHRLLQEGGYRFRETNPLGGGEDSRLFQRMNQAGAVLVWCDEAVVYETVPASRASIGWVLRRAYRVGTTRSACERELYGSVAVGALRIGKATGRIAQGLLMLPLGVLGGPRTLVRAGRHIAWGLGNLAGLLKRAPKDYRVIHGD